MSEVGGPPQPGRAKENSPAIYRWVDGRERDKSREGRKKRSDGRPASILGKRETVSNSYFAPRGVRVLSVEELVAHR